MTRAERLAAIREHAYPKGRCNRCGSWGEECNCVNEDRDWLLSQLERADKVVEAAREVANAEDPHFDDLIDALKAYDAAAGGD